MNVHSCYLDRECRDVIRPRSLPKDLRPVWFQVNFRRGSLLVSGRGLRWSPQGPV